MKLAVIGGTGVMGAGLARQLAGKHQIIIGSRDAVKAQKVAEAIPGASGADYGSASAECDAAIVAVPYSALDSLSALTEPLAGKLVISIVNPVKVENGLLAYPLKEGSAAEALAKVLPKSRVAAAFNNITVGFFKKKGTASLDVLVATDEARTFAEAATVIQSIPNLRPLNAGPLSQAQAIERVTVLMLNLARLNSTGSLSTRFVSQKEQAA